MKIKPSDELLTISDATSILGAPVSQIQSMIDEGRIRTTLKDNLVFLRSSDLHRMVRERKDHRFYSPHKALRWMMVAATVAVMIGSLLPNVSVEKYDKEVHWLAYFVLTTLVTLCVVRLRTTLIGVSLVFSLGAVLEYLQHFVPGRNARFDDLTANYLGVISGAILGFWLKQRWGLQRRVRGS